MKYKTLRYLWRTLVLLMSLLFETANAQNMEKHKWLNRIIIVQAADSENKKYLEQMEEFKGVDSALAERKLILYQFVENKCQIIDFQNSGRKNSRQTFEKNKYILEEPIGFQITLIGLDGGIKLKKDDILRKEDLFALVDSMPMRRQELDNVESESN